MPSPLVLEVRALLRRRAEEGRPLTMPERALLLASLAPPRRDGADVVDELEEAIATARRWAIGSDVPEGARRAVTRLLAASRAVLDYAPALGPDTYDPAAAMPVDDVRRKRADVDG